MFVLLVVTVAASIFHYVDNVMFFDTYPEPAWITPHLVNAFWFLMTPVGVIGYLLFRRGYRSSGVTALFAYGLMNLLTLGHYRYAPPWEIPFRVNLFILLEVGAAITLMAALIWCALRSPPREAIDGGGVRQTPDSP